MTQGEVWGLNYSWMTSLNRQENASLNKRISVNGIISITHCRARFSKAFLTLFHIVFMMILFFRQYRFQYYFIRQMVKLNRSHWKHKKENLILSGIHCGIQLAFLKPLKHFNFLNATWSATALRNISKFIHILLSPFFLFFFQHLTYSGNNKPPKLVGLTHV